MFTYCLVTKGRREYLDEVLNGFNEVLLLDDTQIVIIDNGAPSDVGRKLEDWVAGFSQRTIYKRFEENQSAPEEIWNFLRTLKIDWVTFPGDDDIVIPSALPLIRERIDSFPETIAVAGSMQLIDSSSQVTGEIRSPKKMSGNIEGDLANALCEPPFLFPALFFKFDRIGQDLPPSRYIFDWWLSLTLICSGRVSVLDVCVVKYRVHDNQESFLAPTRRKFFEAQIVLSRFIQSRVFQSQLLSMSEESRLVFIRNIHSVPPIYTDREFGRYLEVLVSLIVADSLSDTEIEAEILNSLAQKSGVFLRSGEVGAFLAKRNRSAKTLPANFRLSNAHGSCDELIKFVNQHNTFSLTAQIVTIGCDHSTSKSDISLNCLELNSWGSDFYDSLIVNLTNNYEENGILDFKISPFERNLIHSVRKFKKYAPKLFTQIGTRVLKK